MIVGQVSRQPGRLPAEPAGFVGREAELSRIAGLFERARLITVTGPGGVGKTRVAYRAAAQARPRFADGVCLVELSALRDPELLPHTVAGALGLPEQSPGTPRDAVLAHLRDRRLLLVLDTCEHLIDACAQFAEAVIGGAPGVTLLTTSREPLDVSGENTCQIPPLPLPPPGALAAPGGQRPLAGTAVELFAQRAADAVPGFTVTADNLPDVIRICDRLDGIPLAIELAAVRLRALPLSELASRLDARLALLTSGQRGGRHKTLRDTIGWSYDLCTDDSRVLWARLSVFVGSFGLDAAEEVCADEKLTPPQIVERVIRLVDRSVLLRSEDETSGSPGGQPSTTARYRMLGALREFGAEQLLVSGDDTAVRNRFTARYLRLASQFRDGFFGDGQLTQLAELRREHANVRAALKYTLESGQCQRVLDGVELATALFDFWRACGLTREGIYWTGKAAERCPVTRSERASALSRRGYLAAMQGDPGLAVASATAGLRLAAELGDETVTAHAYLHRALALTVAGRLTEARADGTAAGERLAALGAGDRLVDLDMQLAYLALLSGDIEETLVHVERGLRRLGGSGERWMQANLWLISAVALFLDGRDTECAWAVARTLPVKYQVGDRLGVAYMLQVSGWLAAREGRARRAAWLLGAASARWQRVGGRLTPVGVLERQNRDAVAKATAELGERQFETLFGRGAGHPLDEIVAFAAGGGDEPGAQDRTASGGLRAPGRLAGQLTSQLTGREQEIALLVATGLSNRQVAERLFISRRTVDAHMEHIFGKLGISSRVALALALREPGRAGN